MNKYICLSAASALAFTSCQQKKEKPDFYRPNIILIMADDMGYSDLGCFGSEIHTPNLDQLAEEGIRITRFYNSSRCCPTRASLLTGLYQHQAGIGNMVSDMGLPAYQGYLNKECVTMAEVLKTAGYQTYISGKWHVGEKEEHWPGKRGFDRSFGLINGASSYFDLRKYRPSGTEKTMALDDVQWYPSDSGFYMTDAFTDYAIEFLQEHHRNYDNPFFLYLPYTAPHWPLHALPEDIAKYKGKYMIGWDSLRLQRYQRQQELGIVDASMPLSPRDPEVPAWDDIPEEEKDMWDQRMAVYAAMIDRMDQGIGRVLDQVKSMGEYNHTLVIFIADNGGCHERLKKNTGGSWGYIQFDGVTGTPNSFDAYERPWANASNTPFRMFKHWVHEGGISSPFIASYPMLIEAGQLNRTPTHIIDLMATFVDLAQAQYPEEYNGHPIKPMQGVSLVPLFRGEDLERPNPLIWEHEGNRAIQKDNWKLVSKYPDNTWELYNMENDRSELNDLGDSLPARKDELIKLYEEWAQKVDVVDWDIVKAGRK